MCEGRPRRVRRVAIVRASTNLVRGRRATGVMVAGATALISGVSVFVNSYGVRAGATPAVYTTAKNLVAVVVLGIAASVGSWRRAQRDGSMASNFVSPPRGSTSSRRWYQWLGLAYVGVVGGGLAFVLFFDGLAQSEPASAAFWRDTMLLWVAVLAVLFLRERLRWWNAAAIVLVVTGEIVVSGGAGHLATSRGELEVLASSVLWAIEIVVAKRLLRGLAPAALALVRMGVGALALIAYLGATGTLHLLFALSADQLHWALWTGALLGAYVATWMTALARARALDVTSVLAGAALVTWLLEVTAGSVSPASPALGLVLVAAGAALVGVGASARRVPLVRT